jgi:predicted  nucleic acid-binding Zn-ribbon protein
MMLKNGMDVDPEMHIQVLQNRLAQAVVREAQMEAAIQQLLAENEQLEGELAEARRDVDDYRDTVRDEVVG